LEKIIGIEKHAGKVRKFYYFIAKCQGSGFSFQSLNQNIEVVIHFLQNKVGVVDFAKAQGLVNF